MIPTLLKNSVCLRMQSSILMLLLLFVCHPVYADEWYSINENPGGKIRQPAIQLEKYPLGNNTEKQFPPNREFTLWVQDETLFKPEQTDTVEIRKELNRDIKTIKLDNALPAIGFRSGNVDIPERYVEKLRSVLREMKNRSNVRLHFIGHSDADKLSPALRAKYKNNTGLSKYRAQVTAEYFQRQLDLPADAVSFDGAGSAHPIADNSTVAGKQRNRRVEIQVWYDEITETTVDKKVVIPAKKLNRLKVCRKETVCKLHYKEGNSRRTRLRHLVKALHTETGQSGVPDVFIRQIRETYNNLGDKRNVVIRFVGHTDNLPLAEAEKRIYGNHIN